MAKLLHIFYHKEGTFSLLCQQVQLFTHSDDERTSFKSIRNFIERFSFGKFFLNLSFQQFMLTVFKFGFS